jgi:ATP-dependent exoDNAse (exonuclease V) alpha subunit
VAVEPERDRLLVQRSGRTRQALSTDGPLFVEHWYCQTMHGAHSKTCERVLIEAPAASAMGNKSQYYVSISRATHHAVLYTDDAERLPQALSREDVKAAALEVQ